MATTSSKRILILGAPKSGKLTLLKELTGSLPSTLAPASATVEEPASSITDPLTTTAASAPPAAAADDDDDKTAETETDSLRPSHAGLSHNLHLKTKYYETHVPVWIDEYHHPTPSPSSSAGIKDWATAFSSVEAQEVVDALGAIIVTFRKPTDAKQVADLRARMVREIEHVHGALVKQYKRKTAALENKSSEVDEDEDEDDDDEFDFIDFDGICLAVAVPSASLPSLSSSAAAPAVELEAEDWEVAFQPFGFEFVDLEKSGRNDYGELLGLARIREALETYGWGDNEGGEARRRDGYEAFDSDDFDDSEPVVARRRGNGAGGKDGDEDDPEFDRELREMQMEMAALHFAIDGAAGDGDGDEGGEGGEGKGAIPDNDIEEIERIMQRMKEVRAQGDGLPLEERRKLADQLANDLLRLI